MDFLQDNNCIALVGWDLVELSAQMRLNNAVKKLVKLKGCYR